MRQRCSSPENPLRAAATALAYFGLAGETAAQKASAPGSFMIQMLDALYTITPELLQAGCRIEIAWDGKCLHEA